MQLKRRNVVPLAIIISLAVLGLDARQSKTTALRIVVIEGEGAVNIIQQKTAVAPLVEVKDRNDAPVAGVVVTFAIRNTTSASFAGGAQTITVTTDAAGRAAATGLTPLRPGTLEIQVSASHQGQKASLTIKQTNATTARPPTGQSAARGGGVSGVVIGVAVAGAAAVAGGAAIVTARSTDPSAVSSTPSSTTPTATAPAPSPSSPTPSLNRSPVVQAPTMTPTAAIVGVSVSFSAQATDPDNDSLSYSWDFGDGNTSTQQAPSFVFQRAGVFMVRVTARDRDAATSAEAPISIKTLSGSWFAGSFAFENGRLSLVHNGSSVAGTVRIENGVGQSPAFQVECPLSGSVNSAAPHVVLTMPRCAIPNPAGFSGPNEYRLSMEDSADTMSGLFITPFGTGSGIPFRRR